MYVVTTDSRIVRVGGTDASEWILIRSYTTGAEVKFDCGRALDCESPLNLKRVGDPGAEPAGKPVLLAFFNVIRQMISEHPAIWKTYSQGIFEPRGQSDPQLRDGVLRLDAGDADLSPLFYSMPTANYIVLVCAVQPDGKPLCPSEEHNASFYCGDGSITFHWDRRERPPLTLQRASSGLVRVFICNAETLTLTENNAVAYIAGQPKYQSLYTRFEDALDALVDIDGGNRNDPTLEPLRRMFLHHLALE
jgi:hypothetical protein